MHTIHDLGIGTSFNIKSLYPDYYSKLTDDDFIVSAESAPGVRTNSVSEYNVGSYASAGGFTITKSYNASTGILTISGNSYGAYLGGNHSMSASTTINCRAYLIK